MVACEQSSRLVLLMADLCGRHFWIRSLAGAAHLQMIAQLSEDELNENRNVMWTKRGQVRLVVIFRTNATCENMAYRSLRSFVDVQKSHARE